MTAVHSDRPPKGALVSRKYSGYGLIGGFGLGSIVGLLLSGPHFYEWPANLSMAVILGSVAAGGILGWMCRAIALSALVDPAITPADSLREKESSENAGLCDADADGCA